MGNLRNFMSDEETERIIVKIPKGDRSKFIRKAIKTMYKDMEVKNEEK